MGNRSKKSQSEQYKRPLRAAQKSLTGIRDSFAIQQRRLLNQLQQQMSSKESRLDEAPRTPPNQNLTELPQFHDSPRRTLRTTLRETPKSGKSNSTAQTPPTNPTSRKENYSSKLGRVTTKEPGTSTTQPKQEEAGSPTTESDDDLRLNAPPPKSSITTVEGISELLFSAEHLKYIIQDQVLYTRFSLFLVRYRPHLVPILLHFIDMQKAMKALEYANAVASSLGPFPLEDYSQPIETAFVANRELDERLQRVSDLLMDEALPAQINLSLVDVVTDAMQKAIMGKQQTLTMQNLIGGLSEVFTLTDPSIQDNPIIYASEEFYNMTGYGRDFVIGRNCRFLQGPKTNRNAIRRLKTNVDNGTEISEILLNYRRDGTPFMNLLLVAPLHDNRGDVKYYIGAQVDVTGLVEQGQGLDGFDSFISSKEKRDVLNRHGARQERGQALQKLAELSEMFDVTENAIVRSYSRSNSMTMDSGYGSSHQPNKSALNGRRMIIEESPSDEDGDEGDDAQSQVTESLGNNLKWKLAPPGVSTGKLPGVYQKYLLLRPAPKLRVIFVSPALRELAKFSKKGFLDCVDSSSGTMEGLKEAFGAGVPVSARISWKHSSNSADSEKKIKDKPKRDTWISATPMLGSDDSIGVWIIVVVTKSRAEDKLNSDTKQQQRKGEESRLSDGKRRMTVSDAETMEHGEGSFISSTSTVQPHPEPTSIFSHPNTTTTTNGARITSKRNSIYSHSFSESMPFPAPESDLDKVEKAIPGNSRALHALQDSDGVGSRKNSGGKEKSGTGGVEMPNERVRIMYTSEDEGEMGGKEAKGGEDDSGVDTVDEDEELGRDRANGRRGSRKETPQRKGNAEGEQGGWTPPSKHIWVKPPRLTLPDRMMCAD